MYCLPPGRTHLELADVGYHVSEEGVAGDVERDPQTLGGITTH